MIAIVDYRAGNLTSVERAVAHLGFPCRVTNDHETLRAASHVIFPGVGAAGASMRNLRQLGLDALLGERLLAGVPILGICVGLQVLFDRSEENDTPCLGFLPGEVRRFPEDLRDEAGARLKVPHKGWNAVRFVKSHPVFSGIPEGAEFYFVHSYYAVPRQAAHVAAETDHGVRFASAVAHRNLVAVQFHAEKSGRCGLSLLANFCRWDGTL